MRNHIARILIVGGLLSLGAPLLAAAPEGQGGLRPLLDCRRVADATERLACFDKESAILDDASARNELTVLDKEAVRKTRRSLFGFGLPRLPFLSDSKDGPGKDAENEEGDGKLTATIASARSLGYGKWAFDLDDGAHWVTTEAVVQTDPAKGASVVIRRGALGAYFASFAGSRQVRVKRVN